MLCLNKLEFILAVVPNTEVEIKNKNVSNLGKCLKGYRMLPPPAPALNSLANPIVVAL